MKILLKPVFLSLLLLVAGSCSIFDSDTTTNVISYSTPTIKSLKLKDHTITIDISINLNSSVHADFTNYIILRGYDSNDISTQVDMSEFTTLSQIPYYIASTGKPSFSGGGVNDLTFSFTTTDWVDEADYKMAVFAFGYNEAYGKYKDSNGWLYSDTSTPISFHRSSSTNSMVINDGSGYSVIGKTLGVGNSVTFNLNNINNSDFYIGGSESTSIRALPVLSDVYEIIEIPDIGYSSTPLPVTIHSTFAIKMSDNSYHKVKVTGIGTASVTIDVVYSLTPDKRKF